MPLRRAVRPYAALLCRITALILLATVARACPACAPGDGKSRSIYVASTVGLSLLPILMIGLGAWLLRRANGGRRTARAALENENAGKDSRRFP